MSKLRLNVNTEGKVKLSLSISLVIYSIIVAILNNAILAIMAMSSGSFGDISIMASRGCLTNRNEDTFNVGVMAFALQHIFYILQMQTEYSETFFIATMIIFLIMLGIMKIAKTQKDVPLCILYAIIIILNAINAFNFSWIAALGMSLFLVSDIILAISKMLDKRSITWQVAIWITYVPAQICMLTAILLK